VESELTEETGVLQYRHDESNWYYTLTQSKYYSHDGRKFKMCILNFTLNTLEHLTSCGVFEIEIVPNTIHPDCISSEKIVPVTK
jgi:hypothetical protein